MTQVYIYNIMFNCDDRRIYGKVIAPTDLYFRNCLIFGRLPTSPEIRVIYYTSMNGELLCYREACGQGETVIEQ